MIKIKKILACVDFSEYSLMTLEYALELAQEGPMQIVVFNVINQRDINGVEKLAAYFPNKVRVEDYVSDLKKYRHEKMQIMINETVLDKKTMLEIKIDTGIPYECILNAVDTEDIDLVVMANKGRGNIARVLFGSAAEKVFRHSPVPVVSVRDRKKFKQEK
ncbi:MAG: universal stress protein [Proteobacteria bacterium]|nr:universal stress protein [Pseudomonadota bacterium]